MKEWFYNNGRKRDRKDKITYVRRWNFNQVVGHVKRPQIQEICKDETEAEPGTQGYMGGYQQALATVMKDLSHPQRRCRGSECHFLIKIVQLITFSLRAAELHGGQYVKEFARQMWMQLGMRVLVLSAHHATDGTLSMAV